MPSYRSSNTTCTVAVTAEVPGLTGGSGEMQAEPLAFVGGEAPLHPGLAFPGETGGVLTAPPSSMLMTGPSEAPASVAKAAAFVLACSNAAARAWL